MAHVDLYNYACLQRMRVGLIWGSFEAINSPGFRESFRSETHAEPKMYVEFNVGASREVSAHLCYNYERIYFSDNLIEMCIYDKCYFV